mmetsp:Transcript_3304/g.7360  ORF Transcript_3304/g.7360 Transcript_3304/m.7360 type:complete len:423 (+) Transcript_3304:277-1545(+)
MKFSLITVAMVLASSSAQMAEPKNNTVVEVEQELNEIIEDEEGLLHQEIELLTALTAEDVPLEAMMTVTSEATEEMMMEHDDVSAPAAEEANHESNHQHKKSERARAKAAKEAKAAGHHSESKSSKKHDTEEHHSMVYEAKSAKSTDAHSMPTDHVVYKAKSAKSKSAKAKSSKAHANNMSVPRESLDHSMPTMAKSAKAHSEPSKAAKVVAPPQLLLTKAHKSAKTGKKAKTHPHRGDDDYGGSLSMMTHSHGKSDKGHPAGGTATTTMEDATTDTHGGVGTNGNDGGGDTTSETADGTTASSITTPATDEVEGVVPGDDATPPAVRAPDVKPRGAGGSELRNGEFQEEANGGVLLHGENKAIGGHKKRQNVDALDMGDGREGVESSLVASASNVNSSADVRGAMVGGFCLLVTSAYAMFA